MPIPQDTENSEIIELGQPPEDDEHKGGFDCCKALKNSHPMISLFTRYDPDLSRGKRANLYFIRTLAMISIPVITF